MNILLIINRFDFGGSENHVRELANILSVKGHKVILVGGDGRQEGKLHSNVKYYRTNMIDLLIPFHIIKIIFLVKKYNIDVIHSHQRLAIIIGGLVGYFTKRKTVATVHGRFRYDMRSPLSHRLTDKIIFVNKTIFVEALEKYNISSKAIVIPNGIFIDNQTTNRKPFKICHVSRLDKSHFTFLKLILDEVLDQLVEKYPSVEFQIVGDGCKKDDLMSLAYRFNQKHKSEKCIVSGYSPSVNTIFQNASLAIGVGRVAIEALAAGSPLISANSKRMGGIITSTNYSRLKACNFVDTASSPPTSQSILKSIVDFFENEDNYMKEAQLLVKEVSKGFSIEMIAERTVSLYQDITIR